MSSNTNKTFNTADERHSDADAELADTSNDKTAQEKDQLDVGATALAITTENGNPHTVGIDAANSGKATGSIPKTEFNSAGIKLPDVSRMPHAKFMPGREYRFRVRAIGSFGVSNWSKVGTLKIPELVPGLPRNIKGFKSSAGIRLKWEPSENILSSIEPLQYFVLMATKADEAGLLSFELLYQGTKCEFFVTRLMLSDAYIEMRDNQPAVTFRFGARNKHGHGPMNQIRWLHLPDNLAGKQAEDHRR